MIGHFASLAQTIIRGGFLRQIEYTLLPDVAGRFLRKTSTVEDFILDVGLLGDERIIPPYNILNNMFSEGYYPRVAEWDPFTITYGEYDELVGKLLSRSSDKKPFTKVDVPDWVTTREDFYFWKCEYVYGVPAGKHKKLSAKMNHLLKEIERNVIEGNKGEVNELNKKMEKLQNEYNQFMDKYRL